VDSGGEPANKTDTTTLREKQNQINNNNNNNNRMIRNDISEKEKKGLAEITACNNFQEGRESNGKYK
jgi:hypothetical protein